MHTDNLRPTELAGLLWMWRRGDRVISLPPLTGFRVTTSPATDVLTALCELEAAEITARLYTRHRPYIAWIEQTPVPMAGVPANARPLAHRHSASTCRRAIAT